MGTTGKRGKTEKEDVFVRGKTSRGYSPAKRAGQLLILNLLVLSLLLLL